MAGARRLDRPRGSMHHMRVPPLTQPCHPPLLSLSLKRNAGLIPSQTTTMKRVALFSLTALLVMAAATCVDADAAAAGARRQLTQDTGCSRIANW